MREEDVVSKWNLYRLILQRQGVSAPVFSDENLEVCSNLLFRSGLPSSPNNLVGSTTDPMDDGFFKSASALYWGRHALSYPFTRWVEPKLNSQKLESFIKSIPSEVKLSMPNDPSSNLVLDWISSTTSDDYLDPLRLHSSQLIQKALFTRSGVGTGKAL